MGNTYTQIHIQVVFVVKYRAGVIKEEWEEELFKYITTIVQNNGHKVLQINGMPDHVHLLFGMRPTQDLSILMKQIKMDSSKWINGRSLTPSKFVWQPGYGAFSYSKWDVDKVIRYIKNQKVQHRGTTFKEEYMKLLEDFGIDYDQKYLFKTLE